MKVNIIKTFIQQVIIESCINVFFDTVKTNFKINTKKNIPNIGSHFSKITDTLYGEVFHDCVVIKPEDMEFYDALDNEERNTIVLAIHFEKSEIDGDPIESDSYQYFAYADFLNLEFKR
jgi:hypothetical protein